MKKNNLSLLLLFLLVFPAGAKSRVIEHPSYEVKNSGIDNIVKIELSDKETRVHVKTTFIPGWWVKFPKTTFILPEGSTEKILATKIENGEFDKEIFMPQSGDSLFILSFPPLDKSVKKFDYGEGDRTIIFGVSLAKNKRATEKRGPAIPGEVEQWLDAEIHKSKIKEALPDYRSDKFFVRQPARLVGYLKGYDPRLGFSTAIIYTENIITREDYPVTVEIHPDGRFEASIPMQYPTTFFAKMNDRPFQFYLEPGHTLAMVLNWEEFLTADRLRNTFYQFKDVEFRGALSEINSQLTKIELKRVPWNELRNKFNTLEPDDYKASELQVMNENEELIRQSGLSPKAATLLSNEALLTYGVNLFEYVDNFNRRALEDTTRKESLSVNYYDFLKQMPMNDQSSLCVSAASTFVNRFEYCNPFTALWAQLGVVTSILAEQLKNELRDSWTEEDEKVWNIENRLKRMSDEQERTKYHEANQAELDAFYKRYATQIKGIVERKQTGSYIREIGLLDSVFTRVLGLSKPNLLYDVAKVRKLPFEFGNLPDSKNAELLLETTTKGIANPFLTAEAFRIYAQTYSPDGADTYVLPETEGGKLFREMTAPLKGRYIVVDFWESWCGPCVAGIKHHKPLREKMKGSSDIAFLFICSEDTPEDTYLNYVEGQELANSYRLTKDQYHRMRELFKFNGIPHYEYVDREGRIMTKGLNLNNIEGSLINLLEKENARE